jgi:transcription antitermination factor NusG
MISRLTPDWSYPLLAFPVPSRHLKIAPHPVSFLSLASCLRQNAVYVAEGRSQLSTKSWFALQIRQSHDYIVPTLLTAKGYEILAPVYRRRRQWSDRIKEIDAPLFPGYVFCRFDPASHGTVPVVTTPGVLKILGFGGKPQPLDEREIESVRLAAQYGLSPRPCQYLSTGSRIRITRGPLSGIEGIFTRIKNKELLVISVAMLQRSISVEIERGAIELVQFGLESQASIKAIDPHLAAR